MKTILGKDLKVGDVINRSGRRARVIKLTPCKQPLSTYLGVDALIAEFDVGVAMIIDASTRLERIDGEGGV